ncbi:MAG: methyltransferase [Ardenticatenaceae bacterium]|nr:methyltransferase [Ardenticatenaceae bacterium]
MNLFELDPQPMADLLHGVAWDFQQARVLQVAVRLDLFTALASGSRTAAELAAALGTDPAMTERLLIALAALDLVGVDAERWANRLAADLYLVAGRPLYQGQAIRHAADLWDLYSDLERAVREGAGGERRALRRRSSPRPHGDFILAMHGLAVAGQAQRLARLVGQFAGRRRLLDVGAGPGTYSIALCERFPTLTATLWDLPESLEIARVIVASSDVHDRIDFQAGNWETDQFGHGYDALLMSNILHGPGSRAREKLVKAYSTLAEGGLLVVQDFLLDNDLSGPLPAALFNLRNGAFTVDQMLAVIEEAGFERVSLVSTAGRTAIVIAFKPHGRAGGVDSEQAAALPEIDVELGIEIPGMRLSPRGEAGGPENG